MGEMAKAYHSLRRINGRYTASRTAIIRDKVMFYRGAAALSDK